ncbi:hypothetical protein [Rhodococcus sp. MEB064]|uniref:hypothetical protein n=1 Tax=Rhodococcus sp. MEB064 TaxID=1587522 RepID=UPI0006961680|nr:hypothetical protein [Rhodococcus sp. MEB064]
MADNNHAHAHEVSLALDRYSRSQAYFDGLVTTPAWLALKPLQVGMLTMLRDGADRHGRMLRDREFDVAETSLSSYVISRSQGLPFIATPVFPRRLFLQTQLFVAKDSPVRSAGDLAGRRVVLLTFQATMSVVARGDLQREYGVPWRSVQWMSLGPEELEVGDLPVTRLAAGTDPFQMLRDGDADAVVLPGFPESVMDSTGEFRRLFPDAGAEVRAQFARNGYMPIMHVLTMQSHVVERMPELPSVLLDLDRQAFDHALALHNDSNYGIAALGRLELERERVEIGADVWPRGLAANRVNLERFVDDMVEQGLIPEPLAVEDLFHHSTHDS